MSQYPNILTPPSSNEDSPQSILYNSPPSLFNLENLALIGQPQSTLFDIDTVGSATAPYLRILEQPIDRFRFRYKSEMTGTHGSLCGQTSDRSRKQTYPTVELCNFNKDAVIRCSIYQHNIKEDHKPHAHRLIRKYGSKGEHDDPHDLSASPEEGYIVTFHSMGIIHTAKKNLIPELFKKKTQLKKEEIARTEGKSRDLTQKEEMEIKGLAEAESRSINLNVVCLRFDAFLRSNGALLPICPPVYTHGINNLKSALTGELKIVRMDHCTSPAKGGREIFILVERVTKKNIRIRFYELDDDDTVLWEAYGKFSDLDVHHQYAIVFKTPPYKDIDIKSPVQVFMELERPSDRARSEPKPFTYTVSSNIYKPGAKRARPSYESTSYDTSLASDELPVPINTLCIDNSLLLENPELQVTSAELQQAMANINSDEFNRIFTEFGQDYANVTTDAPDIYTKRPVARSKTSGPATYSRNRALISRLQRRNSIEETAVAKQVVQELKNFIKTHPSDDKAVDMLRYHLLTENKANALHVSIRQNELSDVMFLLKMVYVWKQKDLLNVRNENRETALHIATYLNSEEIVANLIVCEANVALTDAEMNTAVHIAAANNVSMRVLQKLMSVDDIEDFIDHENNDGNTALNIALDNNNLNIVKLLCLHGADVNKQHKKNGFTPLRFAIEKQNIDVIKFILDHKELNPLIEDFQGINPLQVALRSNPEIIQTVTEFMQLNDYVDVEIKNEIEDNSEEELEEKFAIKLEQISPEELQEMYKLVKNFTPSCLDDLAQILDKSGNWQSLAELLDLGHLLRSGLCESQGGSPTKLVLKIAVETNGDSVLQIREFLENLDEVHAVEIIDNMVRSQFVSC